MLIKAQIKSLPFGSKFTLHPQSNKFWQKGTERMQPDFTVSRVKATRACANGGIAWFSPKHIVWAMSEVE